MEIFGITGTNGKTTISYMLRHILEQSGKETALIGTVVHHIANTQYDAKNTTPGKELLNKYLEEMKAADINYCVMEVSSHGLQQGRVENIPIKYGAFSNLTRDHLDYHKDMESYYEAKAKLFKYHSLKTAVINIDDKYGRRLFDSLDKDSLQVSSVSMRDEESSIFTKSCDMGIGRRNVTIVCQNGEINFTIPMMGEFSALNAGIATALALDAGISLKNIEAAMKSFAGVPGRAEVIAGKKKAISAIVDYAHTPDALANILQAAKDIAEKQGGRLIALFGCGGQRDLQKRKEMGQIAANIADYCVITTDNPRKEDPKQIMMMIEEGFSSNRDKYISIEDREKAIIHAIEFAKDGDIIVVAGKGHENVQIIGEKITPFDDREKIKELI